MEPTLEDLAAPRGSFTIYRPNNSSVTISGNGVAVDVRDGSLLVLLGSAVQYVFGPGQWITVNQPPV